MDTKVRVVGAMHMLGLPFVPFLGALPFLPFWGGLPFFPFLGGLPCAPEPYRAYQHSMWPIARCMPLWAFTYNTTKCAMHAFVGEKPQTIQTHITGVQVCVQSEHLWSLWGFNTHLGHGYPNGVRL